MKKITILAAFAAVMLMGSYPYAASATTAIDLLSAGNYEVLAKTGISTTGTTSITGDIAVSPAASTFITGFSLNLPAAGAFSTSPVVIGKIYAPDYATPTPVTLTTAINDMQTAYTTGAGMTNTTATELGAGNIGGLTIAPGLYKWGTGVIIPTDVTLSGSATDVWVFQIAQTLTVSSGAHVNLSGGAQASNIFWVVAGQTTLGTTSVFNGNILDQTAIVLNTGAVLHGRALAQTAVTLDSNSLTMPAVSTSTSVTPAPVVTPSPTSNGTGTSVSSSSSSITTPTTSVNTQGCTTVNGYSAVTGQLCTTATITPVSGGIVTGCNGTLYSITTGKLCSTNAMTGAVSYNFGLSTLGNWSTGDGVKALQQFLNMSLHSALVVDGALGVQTTAAIKLWQGKNGLVADGLVGSKTKAKMYAEIGY